MRHLIYKLHFTTAVHFGSDDGGDRLTMVRMAFRSDVLFSALYTQALKAGVQQTFLAAVQADRLVFSDALPWQENQLFVPRPVGQYAPIVQQEDSSRRKLMKKVEYLPVSQLGDYLRGKVNPDELVKMFKNFGHSFETTRVNLRDEEDPLPYQIAGFRFAADTGLYVIARVSDQAAEDCMDQLMTHLSATGIGGKISSGWGKFICEKTTAEPELSAYLQAASTGRQILLSTAYPEPDALESVLVEASYTLVRRGGFSTSEAAQPMKKRTCYLFGAGSVFQQPFHGVILDVGTNMPHPVYRCAKALFMGVEPA